MNKNINIGVEELEEIEVGYDAAGVNMEVDQDEVPEGTLLFYDLVSSSSPLPVEDGHYDYIKYSCAWVWVGEEDKQGVADEFYRILSVGGTVFIRDYLARTDWEKGEEIELTHAQWMERLTTYFSESEWDIGPSMMLADGFTVEITLTKKEKSVKMTNKKQEMLRVQMHMELNVLINKMFAEFPHVDNFRIIVDHTENNGSEQISSSADSEVGIEGARTDRTFLHYATRQGVVIIDKETIID